jgi:hypothetical protein
MALPAMPRQGSYTLHPCAVRGLPSTVPFVSSFPIRPPLFDELESPSYRGRNACPAAICGLPSAVYLKALTNTRLVILLSKN